MKVTYLLGELVLNRLHNEAQLGWVFWNLGIQCETVDGDLGFFWELDLKKVRFDALLLAAFQIIANVSLGQDGQLTRIHVNN